MKPRLHYYDLPLDAPRNPIAGEFIANHSRVRDIVTIWRIIEARPCDSQMWGNRWVLTLERAPLIEHADFVATLWHSYPYPKGQKPGTPVGAGL